MDIIFTSTETLTRPYLDDAAVEAWLKNRGYEAIERWPGDYWQCWQKYDDWVEVPISEKKSLIDPKHLKSVQRDLLEKLQRVTGKPAYEIYMEIAALCES